MSVQCITLVLQVVTLHRRLGKPIPEVKMPTITNTTGAKAAANIAQKEGKTVQVRRARSEEASIPSLKGSR